MDRQRDSMMGGGRDESETVSQKGFLAWMARNKVAANLVMLVLLIGGVVMSKRLKQEVFPEFSLDIISVSVAYPGASPEEVEQGVILAIEEAVRGIDGVENVTSSAGESGGGVYVELLIDADPAEALNEVRGAVDRITSFPLDAERPIVSLIEARRQVLSLVVYGDFDESTLREVANRSRDDLLQHENITLAEVSGVRPLEVSIEVPQESLRRYGLTLEQIAQAVAMGSIDLPGGGLKTDAGEVLLRTTERRDFGSEFEEISLASRPDGSQIRVSDVGTVIDGFRDTDTEVYFDGQRAALVNVFRVGNQTPIDVSEAVKEYIEEQAEIGTAGVNFAIWNDMSEVYRDRVNLLLRNGYIGLTLVLLTLGLFLEFRLAFWVTLGIPISFLGALLLMPMTDVSINMISLFAFILTLGIVVDDAIVVGEAVYHKRQQGLPFLSAAIAGVREMVWPVTFSILTTIVAFTPMLFVPGVMGKIWAVIPTVVILVLLLSLVEAFLILPAHLAHSRSPSTRGFLGLVTRGQRAFSNQVEKHIQKVYIPIIRRALGVRYLTMALCVTLLILTVGWFAGGRMPFTFMPKIESDVIQVGLTMPFGTAVEETSQHVRYLAETAQDVVEQLGDPDLHSRGIIAAIGSGGGGGGGPMSGMGGSTGSHLGQVAVFLVSSGERPFTAREFTRVWRERVGEIPGADSLIFDFNIGPSAGSPIDIQLTHSDVPTLERAASRLAEMLSGYSGVIDIDDGVSLGKEQLDLRLRPGARSLGVTETGMARQLRSAFFGAEAVRQQRGRDEVRVYVRLPESERSSEYDIEEMLIRTPSGGEIPLGQAADISRGRSYTQINRRDGRRVMNVTADIEADVTNATEVVTSLEAKELPDLMAAIPGLHYDLAGEQEEQREVLGNIFSGFAVALMAMFALMAIAFKSYFQPIIIMFAIPFGMVGALMGHMVMGYNLSLMSLLGIVALSGVVVNDALILIVAINRNRDEGMSVIDAVVAGGERRFRAVVLTSLTTFFGLAPMIAETSVQARFLIPMAISLGFGVLFATFITMLIVPVVYLILDDIRRTIRGFSTWLRGDRPKETPDEQAEAFGAE